LMTLLDIVGEPLLVHGVGNAQERTDRVVEILRLVGLRPEYMRRYPHAFSGGQRQRVGIARALALNPRLVVADEPVSALDVSVQAQILNLMLDLQAQLGLTYLFVAHDLSVVKHVSDRVAVMYVGQIVEMTETEALFTSPRHPYTEALLSAVPKPDPRLRAQRIVLEGEVADAAHPPPVCYFHPRCGYAVERCRVETPRLASVEPGHFVACHRARELTLRRITPQRAGSGLLGSGLLAAPGRRRGGRDPHHAALAEPVRRGGDHLVAGLDAPHDLDGGPVVPPQLDRLEADLLLGPQHRDARAGGLDDQGAGRDDQGRVVALEVELHVRVHP